jgi:MoxR-like ATPase
MVKAFNSREAPKAALAVLKEQTEWLTITSWKNKVCERMGVSLNQSNNYYFQTLISSLEATDVIEVKSKNWLRLKVKDSGQSSSSSYSSGDNSTNTAHVTLLKKQIELLEKKLTESTGKVEVIVEKEVVKYLGIELKDVKGATKKIEGIFHKQFKRLMQLAQARMNIMIFGPTGCGKSHVCQQLADALDLRFRFVSCTAGMSEGVLAGKLLPVGTAGKFEYVMSEFVDCFENGGVFLLDEMDAADPNVLLLINAALANGEISLTNRPKQPYAKRHKDFICIAAANTAGTNADRLYNGRNKLDGATLDRFQVGKVVFDYDIDVELQLCPDEELLARCHKIRKAIDDNRLERAMSTRFIKDAYLMKTQFEWTYEELDQAYFAGWREDEINKVKYAIK